MDKSPLASNPFALMMHPDAVFQAMEHSDRLSRLQRRVCRPLDKPMIPCTPEEVAAFDAQVDDTIVPDEPIEPLEQ
jgi:hypothetical protein